MSSAGLLSFWISKIVWTEIKTRASLLVPLHFEYLRFIGLSLYSMKNIKISSYFDGIDAYSQCYGVLVFEITFQLNTSSFVRCVLSGLTISQQRRKENMVFTDCVTWNKRDVFLFPASSNTSFAFWYLCGWTLWTLNLKNENSTFLLPKEWQSHYSLQSRIWPWYYAILLAPRYKWLNVLANTHIWEQTQMQDIKIQQK